jgi:anti-sigma factor RsiW
MTDHRRDPNWEPRPEQLAAYADGELDAACRREVEVWLADHPEAAAEVAAWGRLDRLTRESPLPEPAEAQWSAVLGRIEAALVAAPVRPTAARVAGRLRSFWAAAAVLLALLLAVGGVTVALLALAPLRNGVPAIVEQPEEETPLPVASAADIEIISMDAADLSAVLVGEPPLRGHVVLVSKDEVSQIHIAQDWEDRVRLVGMGDESSVPMIIASLGKDEED